MGDIGGWVQGQEREGRGEQPQGPEGGGKERRGGGEKNEGWSGGSDGTSDMDTEEEGWGHATLTASSLGTQESGARGLRVDARASMSNSRKAPSATADKAGTRGRHGEWQEQGAKKGGR